MIIKRVESSKALELLEKFEAKIVYNKKLKEINNMFTKWEKPIPSDYCKMVGIINRDYAEIILEDCFKIDTYISECLREFQCIEYSESNSVKFVWLVPIAAVKGLCQKAAQIIDALKRESFKFFEIHGITIFDDRNPTLEAHRCNNDNSGPIIKLH